MIVALALWVLASVPPALCLGWAICRADRQAALPDYWV